MTQEALRRLLKSLKKQELNLKKKKPRHKDSKENSKHSNYLPKRSLRTSFLMQKQKVTSLSKKHNNTFQVQEQVPNLYLISLTSYKSKRIQRILVQNMPTLRKHFVQDLTRMMIFIIQLRKLIKIMFYQDHLLRVIM